MGIFITGTDTGVGKTFVGCLVARLLSSRGRKVGVMKPVETGCRLKDGVVVPWDSLRLLEASCSDIPLDMVNPYRSIHPLAPNLATRLDGETIDPGRLKSIYEDISRRHDVVIVEGAGGLLCPLTDDMTMADLALSLGLSLLVVAPNRLGVINHTLLTLEYARKRGMDVKGVVLNSPEPPGDDPSRLYNRCEIERLGGVRVVCEVPFSEKGDPTVVKVKSLLQAVLDLV